MTLGQFPDASSYFESASRVAAKCMNPYAAADALERQGDAELASRKPGEAMTAWSTSEQVAATVDYYDRQESALERMHKLYSDAHRFQDAEETRKRLEAVRLERERAARAKDDKKAAGSPAEAVG